MGAVRLPLDPPLINLHTYTHMFVYVHTYDENMYMCDVVVHTHI